MSGHYSDIKYHVDAQEKLDKIGIQTSRMFFNALCDAITYPEKCPQGSHAVAAIVKNRMAGSTLMNEQPYYETVEWIEAFREPLEKFEGDWQGKK